MSEVSGLAAVVAGGGEFLTAVEVGARLRVHRTQVNKWAKVGVRAGGVRVRLGTVVVGDRFRFTPEAVEKFLADCRRAKLGPDAPEPKPETPSQERRRVEREVAEAYRACGLGPDGGDPPARRPKKPR